MSAYPSDVPPPLSEVDELPSWDDLPGIRLGDESYVDITGFEYVRNDSAVITGKLQKAIFDAILKDDASKDEVADIIDDFYLRVKRGEVDVLEACRGPSIKDKDKYKDYRKVIQARAGFFTDQFFDDVNVQPGDNVYYVYVSTTGYNHSGKKLPENMYGSSKAIGMIEGMEPPMAKVTCTECGHNWELNEFGQRIQREHSCPECGLSKEDTDPKDPFDVDGCFAQWEKIADKHIKQKARKVLKHIGWEDIVDSIGEQDTFAAFA